ncbi:MAG: UDP-2,3-diacylglucosamine diphosphatase LpxI [Planctomycetaceae bacterium]|nr:UDP-2,3-diacylglucosamine diphosphatase LpxI [Planctomycetaceae bacterium]
MSIAFELPAASRIAQPRRVGLMAGWGRYPIIVAESLRRAGCEVYCVCLKDHADPQLNSICNGTTWIGMAKVGRAIRYFRRHGVTDATMAGKIHKVRFFQPWVWFKHLPDWRAIRRFYPHFFLSRADRKDDTLLTALIEEFALDGIRFAPATDYVPELLAKPGQLTRRGPSGAQWKDIEFGWGIAREMGRLDIGQSVAIHRRATIAVEAIEGTDECIRRAGQLCRAGGFTVVKVAKPQQDMRFDVPTIGVGTLRTMVEARASVLAVEAGRTILLDQADTVRYADEQGLVIVVLDANGNLVS